MWCLAFPLALSKRPQELENIFENILIRPKVQPNTKQTDVGRIVAPVLDEAQRERSRFIVEIGLAANRTRATDRLPAPVVLLLPLNLRTVRQKRP